MKEQTCIVWVNICIWISLSTVVAESVNEGSKTVCSGSDVDFFFGIYETIELHIVIIKHKSNEIGRYSTDTGVEVYQKFKDHYLIVKNTFDIQVHISNVKEEDNGTVSGTVIYYTKRFKYEYILKIQEKLTSSVMDFKKTIGDPCTVLTCSANSNQLVLKKPDNQLITETNIVLDSCHQQLPTGEFSCCLMANCSEAECKKITLDDSEIAVVLSKRIWIIVLLSVALLMMLFIAFIIIYGWKTRRYKEGTKTSKATQTPKMSDTGEYMNHEPQQGGDSVRSKESKSSKSSERSQYSDNFFFISENREQIPMVLFETSHTIPC